MAPTQDLDTDDHQASKIERLTTSIFDDPIDYVDRRSPPSADRDIGPTAHLGPCDLDEVVAVAAQRGWERARQLLASNVSCIDPTNVHGPETAQEADHQS